LQNINNTPSTSNYKKGKSEYLNKNDDVVGKKREPKFWLSIIKGIKKDKGINIFKNFDYIINSLIHLHLERHHDKEQVQAFRDKYFLSEFAARKQDFIPFLNMFPDFNFFEYFNFLKKLY